MITSAQRCRWIISNDLGFQGFFFLGLTNYIRLQHIRLETVSSSPNTVEDWCRFILFQFPAIIEMNIPTVAGYSYWTVEHSTPIQWDTKVSSEITKVPSLLEKRKDYQLLCSDRLIRIQLSKTCKNVQGTCQYNSLIFNIVLLFYSFWNEQLYE